MEYGRLGKSEPLGSSSKSLPTLPSQTPKRSKLKLLLILASTLMVASAISAAAVVVVMRSNQNSSHSAAANLKIRRPSQAISRTCSLTRYPTLCVDSLLDFPDAVAASGKDLVHITVNATLHRFDRAIYLTSNITNLVMDSHVRSAYEDCLELLEDSVSHLSRSLSSIAPGVGATGSTQDVLTWLSAALTNHDTCTEGFSELDGDVKHLMFDMLKDLSGLVSNCLAIYSAAGGGQDFYGIPIQNRRRKLLSSENMHKEFPRWLSRRDRMLLDSPATGIEAHVIVSKDGSGTCKTITEAIKRAPEKSARRFIIYVKAGRYEEDILTVGRKKTNIMFIGDGKGRTVISGGRNVQQGTTTFRSATFAATGEGFIARDITFENTAGPSKHQAVALRVGADHAVIFRCSIIGYQDTLYVYSQRQFYRDCDIYGTVDFIFGNAAVVFQNCIIHARKPLPLQKNTITAQGRQDPNQNTGMSFHDCRLVAEPDLQRVIGSYPTYLGRPWKLYSRVVYMLSYMGDHIHPRGWLEWSSTFALDTLHYGEYMNYGPGGATGQRVKWTGFHVITSTEEASKFTVGQFIYGPAWLPSTGVSFVEGLST